MVLNNPPWFFTQDFPNLLRTYSQNHEMKTELFAIALCLGLSSSAQNCLEFSDIPADFAQAFHDHFDKHVEIFGVHLVATSSVPEAKALHAAGVLAQWIDNDEDGVADNAVMVGEMASLDATMIMFDYPDSDEFEDFIVDLENEISDPWDLALQDLYAEETHPDGSSQAGGFDASLEECLHLVTHYGYSNAYPTIFGEEIGTSLADAMDIARGGQFETIPDPYPAEAWYHYDDWTCDYGCMATEYIYWGLTSWLGGQNYPGRCNEIDNEWELCEPADFQSTDVALHGLITDAQYNMPTILPDGEYCVATNVEELEMVLKVWPNPVGEVLNIQVTGVDQGDNNITVSDSLGRKVFEEKLVGNRFLEINASSWSSGVYTVRIGQQSTVVTKR